MKATLTRYQGSRWTVGMSESVVYFRAACYRQEAAAIGATNDLVQQ